VWTSPTAGGCRGCCGRPACVELERATTEQIRDRLLAAGLATADEIDQHVANLSDGLLDLATSPMVTAWGRVPSDDRGGDQ
jgi:hypothetical protein